MGGRAVTRLPVTVERRRAGGRRSAVGVVLALALVAGACSGGGDGDDGNVLRYGLELEINLTSGNFDPAKSQKDCDRIVIQWIYDTLTRVDRQGNVHPNLAERWELDERTFTLHLRDGVEFQDGSPYDAAAVKKGLEHLKKGEQTGPELAIIDTIDVVDDLTVRLNLEDDTGSKLPALFAHRQGMIVAPAALDAGTSATKPVGAGPYQLTRFQPGEVISLRAFDGYWKLEERKLGGIDFTQVAVGGPAVNALKGKDLDLVSFEAESLPEVENKAGIGTDTQLSQQYLQLQFRMSRPPFDKLEVRQAVNHAINRDELNQVVLAGKGEVAWMPFPQSSKAYNAAVAQRYPYDVEKAKRLLRQAGYPDGFEFTMVIPGGGIVGQERQAEILQAQLAKAGIRATIRRSTEIAVEYYLQKIGEAFSAARLPDPNPVVQMLDQWGKFRFVAVHNGAEHDDLTEVLKRAQSTSDPAELKRLLDQATTIVVENALEAPLVFQPRNVAWDTGRVGGTVEAPPSACDPVDLRTVTMKE